MTPLSSGLLIAVAIACAFTTSLSAGQGATAPELKAGFLLQFARYATWPAAALPPGSGMSICVVGDDRVADTLADLASRQQVQDHSVTVSRVKIDKTDGCHVLFWSRGQAADRQALLDALLGKPVLTVSDATDFAQSGGIINLFVEAERMRFAVNPAAADRAGLKISSNLLKLAVIRADLPAAPVRVGGKIKPPSKVTHVEPVYPRLAHSARTTGNVVIEATIGVDGRVQGAKILESIPLLNQAALEAVRKWTFTPTTLNGVPVPVIMTVTVTFKLQ